MDVVGWGYFLGLLVLLVPLLPFLVIVWAVSNILRAGRPAARGGAGTGALGDRVRPAPRPRPAVRAETRRQRTRVSTSSKG